jgi:hypothetical protein
VWGTLFISPLFAAGDPTIGLLQEIAKAGPTVILLIVGWLLLTDRLVSGKTHNRVLAERDQLLRLALMNAQIAKQSIGKLEEASQDT